MRLRFWRNWGVSDWTTHGLGTAILLFTIINAGATVIYVYTYRSTVRDGTKQTDQLIYAAHIQAQAAQKMAEATSTQAIKMAELAQQTERASKAATRSADEARKANDFARDSLVSLQRAFIVVDPNNLRVQLSQDMGKEEAHFFFTMENTGATPTRNLVAHINTLVGTEAIPKNFDYPDVSSEPGDRNDLLKVIGPKNTYPLEGIVSRAEYELLYQHQLRLYFYGWVEYNDIFEKTPRHITRFCFEATAIAKAITATGQVGQAMQLRHIGTFFNCYDEECQPRKQH